MSCYVAGWSLLHFELKYNYYPKAQAPVTPRLSDPLITHITALPYCNALKSAFEEALRLFCQTLCLFEATGRPVTTEGRQSFPAAPFL